MEPVEDLLGSPYVCETLPLQADAEGEVVATLVHRPPDRTDRPRRAVLHVHGYNDYFFHTEYADFWAQHGYDFYALDLRKCGRSLRPHQTPYFVADLTDYYEELGAAWRLITERDGHSDVVLSAHSTGGLTAALWAHDTRVPLAAGVLNAPWLDMKGSAMVRTVGGAVVPRVASYDPMREIPRPANPTYGRTLSARYDGEWEYNLEWKRPESWPFRAGWLTAVAAGHRRVHAGLDIDAPLLVLSSRHSADADTVSERAHRCDIVLDVHQIRRWSVNLGPRVTSLAIDGAKHDVILSRPAVRAVAYAELAHWLGAYGPKISVNTEE